MPTDTSDFQLTHSEPGSIVPASPIARMLEGALKGGITTENVAALQGLMQLYREEQDRDAERQFAAAFVALQSEMPNVQAVKAVPNNDGSVRYKFAPYESIMEQVRPLLLRHGFSVTFSSDAKDGRVVQSCTLQHTGGHKRTNQFAARVGKGPPSSSEAQGDGAASTYAKRHALCDALNITIEHDTDGASQDARGIGAPITRDQVTFLRESLAEAGGTEEGLLKLAGAATLEEVGAAVYPVLVRALEARKRNKK